MNNRFDLPNLGYGLGLRSPHYDDYLENRPTLGWLEIITENFIDAHQGYWDFLAELRQDYAFAMHGVSLSIGSTDPINRDYLHKIKSLANFLQPAWISDHLCFTGILGQNTHDLLPVPYTDEALMHIASRIHMVQDILERPILLENPSTYITFNGSTLHEHEFIAALAEEANCGLLLDVNNVVVSAYNHGLDANVYIDAIPADRIVQIHLAGHTDKQDYKIDTHDREVPDTVWDLYRYVIETKGSSSTMIEWDEHVPTFEVLYAEIEKAMQLSSATQPLSKVIHAPTNAAAQQNTGDEAIIPDNNKIDASLSKLQHAIIHNQPQTALELLGRKTPSLPARLSAYIKGYRIRLEKTVQHDYPALRHYLGEQQFDRLAAAYVEQTPSHSYSIDPYPLAFADYVHQQLSDDGAKSIAALESAISEVFWLADSPAFIPPANMGIEELTQLTLTMRTASKLMALPADAHAYLSAFRSNAPADTAKVMAHTPTHLLVLRHEHEVKRHALSATEYALLNALSTQDVSHALDTTMSHSDAAATEVSEQLGNWLNRWITNGFFTAHAQ